MNAGQYIDPGFSGVLVLGGYNASPRSVVLEFEERICNVEFPSSPAAGPEGPHREYPSHAQGHLPREVKDYHHGPNRDPLVPSHPGSVSGPYVQSLALSTITYKVILPILIAIFGGVVVTLLKVWMAP